MAFPARDAPGLAAWTRFRELVARGLSASEASQDAPEPNTARAPSSAEHPVGIWRMLASNNREVARSATAYPSFESARLSVLGLQTGAEQFEVRTFRGPSSGMHGWAVLASGRIAFTCARWYETSSISLEVATSSIAAFRSAAVTDAPWQTAATAREAREARLAVQAW